MVITITTSPKKHHFHNNHYQHHHSHRQAIDASPWPSALELLKTAGWLQNLRGLSRAAQLLPGWRSSVALLGALVEDGRGLLYGWDGEGTSTTLLLVFLAFCLPLCLQAIIEQ